MDAKFETEHYPNAKLPNTLALYISSPQLKSNLKSLGQHSVFGLKGTTYTWFHVSLGEGKARPLAHARSA